MKTEDRAGDKDRWRYMKREITIEGCKKKNKIKGKIKGDEERDRKLG
jgi:hypothetical protein